jgi:hypothetical protein
LPATTGIYNSSPAARRGNASAAATNNTPSP